MPASCRRILKFPPPIARIFRERIARALKPAREAGLLPSFPFGSDFTDVEQRLIPALQILQDAQRRRSGCRDCCGRDLTRGPDAADSECLARLGLDRPATLAERAYRALVSAALARSRGQYRPRWVPIAAALAQRDETASDTSRWPLAHLR